METSYSPIQDCPIYNLQKTSGLSIPVENGFILFPNEHLTAQVFLPPVLRWRNGIHAHVRSTFARLGIDVFMNYRELERILCQEEVPEYLPILIKNQGDYPVYMREGDTVAVANHQRLMAHPVPISCIDRFAFMNTYEMSLHIGDTYLEVIKEELPVHRSGCGPYIDPHSRYLDSQFEEYRFTELKVEPGESWILSTKEWVGIPEGKTGLFDDNDAVDNGLQHSSATLAHYGKPRRFAVEFLVRRSMVIIPGMHALNLRVYNASAKRAQPERYADQKSIRPNGCK